MTPEQLVHKSIAAYLDLALTPPDWWTTFPAQWLPGKWGKIRGGQLKDMGLKRGVPDILLIRYPGAAYWLEVKPYDDEAEDYQKAMHVRLALAGCAMPEVVHDIIETHDALVKWGFPLRAQIS